MSRQELHDLLVELEHKRNELDPVAAEQNHRLDEIIESLEQQKLYPEDFDHYSALGKQLQDVIADIDQQHPALTAVLKSISQVLQNFRV